LLAEFLVLRILGKAAQGLEGFKADALSIFDLALVDHIVVLPVTAKVGGSEACVGTFREVVDTPVKAIEIEVNVTIVGCRPAHGALRVFHPGVASALGAQLPGAVPMNPGIVVVGAQDQSVEFFYGRIWKHGIMQLRCAVLLFEEKAEGVLWGFFRLAIVIALNADAAIDLEFGLAVGGNKLNGTGTFPGFSALQRVKVNARA